MADHGRERELDFCFTWSRSTITGGMRAYLRDHRPNGAMARLGWRSCSRSRDDLLRRGRRLEPWFGGSRERWVRPGAPGRVDPAGQGRRPLGRFGPALGAGRGSGGWGWGVRKLGNLYSAIFRRGTASATVAAGVGDAGGFGYFRQPPPALTGWGFPTQPAWDWRGACRGRSRDFILRSGNERSGEFWWPSTRRTRPGEQDSAGVCRCRPAYRREWGTSARMGVLRSDRGQFGSGLGWNSDRPGADSRPGGPRRAAALDRRR